MADEATEQIRHRLVLKTDDGRRYCFAFVCLKDQQLFQLEIAAAKAVALEQFSGMAFKLDSAEVWIKDYDLDRWLLSWDLTGEAILFLTAKEQAATEAASS